MKFVPSLMFWAVCSAAVPVSSQAAQPSESPVIVAAAVQSGVDAASNPGNNPAALTADAPMPADARPAPDARPPHAGPREAPMGPGGMREPHPFGMHPGGPPEVHAAIDTIDEIEGLYIDTGKASELPAFYRSVLAKTHDPMVRNVVQHRLADAQLKPAHADEAIQTLRSALDETLARLDSTTPPPPSH